jgi:wyosine [tRNA(Phe)-imidazoG37] synthetase (radical SAM superfamily)
MKYVFGPVPSRRLGQSLGIDPVPLKTCNWNCVYCQLGRSSPLITTRKFYAPPEDILDEVRQALQAHVAGKIDWVTFVGSGETSLYSGLGWLIRQIKTLTSLPLAVITNGSLLYLPEVQEELSAADAVLPSLDAGTPKLFRRINRPHPQATFERLLEGLIAFRDEFRGQLWVEVMLVGGLNDSEAALHDIVSALERIRPDQVHLVLPTRPPVEIWVQPPDEQGLMRAQAILGKSVRVITPAHGEILIQPGEALTDALLSIITRHPLCEGELPAMLGHERAGEALSALEELRERKQAQVVERYGLRFWSAAAALYRDEDRSRPTSLPHTPEQK